MGRKELSPPPPYQDKIWLSGRGVSLEVSVGDIVGQIREESVVSEVGTAALQVGGGGGARVGWKGYRCSSHPAPNPGIHLV